jgi:plasmid stabilization system protein ParE
VQQALGEIKYHPAIGKNIHPDGTRQLLILKYHTAIMYHYFPGRDLIRILAVTDTRRKPGYWKNRK